MKRLLTFCVALMLATGVHAAELGDDGLHKAPWMRDTFKDLREDLEEATSEGRRMLIMVEQRGCVYCTKMHKDVYPDPRISSLLEDTYYVVQINLHGDTEVVDFDGEALTEKDAVRKWGVLFTPTNLFIAETVPDDAAANQATVAIMPGAFAVGTSLDMFTWVAEKRYEDQSEEDFQRYHARMIQERNDGNTD